MKYLKFRPLASAALVVFIAGLALFALYLAAPRSRDFVLQVDNQSGLMVDYVRLFGEGLEQDALLLQLQPGQQGSLSTRIKPAGALRFEVSQGGNRIDTYVVEDTRVLDDLKQRLTIHPHNRFILSRQ